jgi:hypothetical protein
VSQVACHVFDDRIVSHVIHGVVEMFSFIFPRFCHLSPFLLELAAPSPTFFL